MAFIDWKPEYEVGIPVVDRDHRHLLELLNRFEAAHQEGHAREDVLGILRELIRYAEEHFQREEALMDESGYLDLLEHQLVHEDLVRQIFALHERYSAQDNHIPEEVQEFLKRWFLEHILHMDMRFGEWYRQEKPGH